jgi:hypothetical protein
MKCVSILPVMSHEQGTQSAYYFNHSTNPSLLPSLCCRLLFIPPVHIVDMFLQTLNSPDFHFAKEVRLLFLGRLFRAWCRAFTWYGSWICLCRTDFRLLAPDKRGVVGFSVVEHVLPELLNSSLHTA